jgi:hypothetical protein
MKKTISLVLVLVLGLATEVANADFIWGTPTNPGPPVNSSYGEAGVCISANGLEFYFSSDRSGGHGGFDLWVMKRPTIDDDWGDPVNLGSPANSQYSSWEPSISSDGLSLYFSDGHTPQFGNQLPGRLHPDGNIWMITRETIHDAWGEPVNIGSAVNSQHAVHPSISADGLSLYFQSHRPGRLGSHCDTMVATRESISDSFGNPVFLKNTNSNDGEWMPDISADGRTLFFSRSGATVLWVAMRATMYEDFGSPLRLPPQINLSSYLNNSPCLSADGSTLYFTSDRSGGVGSYDIWQVSISTVIDLNGDGIINAADMCIMVDHWGEDYSLCDIAPPPFGDGIVDVQDLILLSEHLFEEIFPVELIGYWKLDEEEGDIAYNSIGDNHGILSGNPTWQPDSGQVAGTLEFDGTNDYVETGFVLNPTDGAFSVFAWIKGGAPGQVIISQADGIGTGETWLGMDALGGNLMTGLMPYQVGRTVIFPLESQSLITDGQWHHIGFVWDGSYRSLYVDGTEVAKDTNPITLSPLIFADGGLYFGTSKILDAGTFFSGLIDDVHIYDKTLTTEQIAALAQ